MAIVSELNGDLVELFNKQAFQGIAHGCNCQHQMGAGIALTISRNFPVAYTADLRTAKGDQDKLGQYSRVYIARRGDIFNLYTQFYPGKELKRVLHNSIAKAFSALNAALPEDYHLGIPQIGCGLAGGTWKDVKKIINDATPNLRITLVNYVPKH